MVENGQQMIQIVDTENQVSWMIFPSQRTYMELRGGKPSTKKPATGGEIDPCIGIKGAQCKRLGTDTIHGRKAVKWEMTVTHQGKSYRNLQWMDTERGMVLRQEGDGGQLNEMKMLGFEKLGGRTVEKWEIMMSRGNQAPQRSYRWFDAELNLAVREEFPGGYVREMRNIVVAPQSPTLFNIPAGYKRVTPQPGMSGRR